MSAPGGGSGAPGSGLDRPSPDVEAVLVEAHRLADEGDWQAMARVLEDALDDHPDDPFVLCWLGVAEGELGEVGAAYDRFKACLAAAPEEAHILATAGAGIAALDDPDAEPALRTAAMLAPDVAYARWMYGAYLSREGFLEDALRELQVARALDPDEAGISYDLGVALAFSGNPEGAVDELYRAGELDPEDGWIRVVLGLALVEAERLDEAVAELVAGARTRPEDGEAQLLAALAAAAEGEQDLAWEMLERARLVGWGADAELADSVEEQIEEGPLSARQFLLTELSPGAYRERLGERP